MFSFESTPLLLKFPLVNRNAETGSADSRGLRPLPPIPKKPTVAPVRGTLHSYCCQWDLKGYDVREERIVGLLKSGILLAEDNSFLSAQVRLRKLEGEAFPRAK